jgi:hypothetical protein
MASFEIRWRTSTKKDLRSIPREDVSRIVDAVGALTTEPLPLLRHALEMLSHD